MKSKLNLWTKNEDFEQCVSIVKKRHLVLTLFLFLAARHFLCRALLAVNNIFDVTEILEDQGHGISNGLSINMIFCT